MIKLFPKLYHEYSFDYDACAKEYFTLTPIEKSILDYGEFDEGVSTPFALFDAIRGFHKNWKRRTVEKVVICDGREIELLKLNATWQQLLTECRKLEKAGVSFK